MAKKIQTLRKKAPKSPEFFDADSEDSENDEKQKPGQNLKPTALVKEITPESPEFVETNTEDSESSNVDQDILRDVGISRKIIQPAPSEKDSDNDNKEPEPVQQPFQQVFGDIPCVTIVSKFLHLLMGIIQKQQGLLLLQ